MPNCKACSAEIRFTQTASGKMMPVDAKPTTDGNVVLFHEFGVLRSRAAHLPADQLRPRHVSHFATCSKADSFRRDTQR